MEENEININDINKKLDDIIIKNKLLEDENKEFKERFLKAENTIYNLNIQLNFLRKEYKMLISEFKKKYENNISLIFELISQNNEKMGNIEKMLSQIEERISNIKTKNTQNLINEKKSSDEIEEMYPELTFEFEHEYE